jgi:hypothetical protein
MPSTTWTHPQDHVRRRRWTRFPEPAARASLPTRSVPPIA